LLAVAGCSAKSGPDAAGAQPDPLYADADDGDYYADDDDYLDGTIAQVIADPIEPWNRFWFTFNDYTYEYVLRPLHRGYSIVVPAFARTGISNFFHNLGAPVRMVNNLLQGKGRAAGAELSSFLLNSTAGLGGLVDVTRKERLAVIKDDEDGGQTLGVWGLGEGFYIVWPLLGPSNARDALGMGLDHFISPNTYLIESWEISLGAHAFAVFNEFDEILSAYDTMKGMAVEPYTAIRDAYTQLRRSRIDK
jgi:phospholipid-binding lipoprotein MlaA